MTYRILLVEDNEGFAYGVRNNLEIEGWEVEVAADGITALAILQIRPFHLVILDLMLPGKSGIQVLMEIRAAGLDVPIMVVTALHEQVYWLRGLALGADMYVEKPLPALPVFLAMVRGLLRRGPRQVVMTPAEVAAAAETFGTDVPIDPTGGPGLHWDGRFFAPGSGQRYEHDAVVELTPIEHKLLLHLILHARRVLSEEELLREVWGYEPHMGIKKTGVLRDTIYRLRRKIEKDPKHPVHIITVWRKGYRFDPS